jgi:hypothetical protein
MKNVLCVLLLTPVLLCGQSPVFSWAAGLGGTLIQQGESVTTDASGNVFTTGWFEGVADFDPGPGVTSLTCAGVRDMFLTKFDAAGNFAWVKRIGGSSSDAGMAVTTTSVGEILVAGYFSSGTVDMDPGAGTFNLTSSSGSGGFVLKLSAAGNFMWAKGLTGNNTAVFNDLALTPGGDIFLTGSFYGTADFDPGAGTDYYTSYGFRDFFLIKLNSSGTYQWGERFGGTNDEVGNALAVDGFGRVGITGNFKGTCNFDPFFTTNMTTSGNQNAFVMCIFSSGALGWARQFSETANNYNDGLDIACDGASNFYCTGTFAGTCYLPGHTLVSNGGYDGFVARFDQQGSVRFFNKIGGPASDAVQGITIENGNFMTTTGTFSGTADFDPTSGTANLTASGLNDAFVWRCDTSGAYIWAGRIGGQNYDLGTAIFSDGSQNLYLTGYYQSSSDMDPTPGSYTMTAQASADAFVIKLGPCISPAAPVASTPTANLTFCANKNTTLSVSSSNPVNWYSTQMSTTSIGTGTSYITPALSAGTYSYYADATTCAASVNRAMIVVTVNPLPSLAVVSSETMLCLGGTATITVSGASSYTWDSGATGNSFTTSPTVNTTYTVTGLDANGCMNTSQFPQNVVDCTTLGLKHTSDGNVVSVYPSPCQGGFTLQSAQAGRVRIFDSLGRLVLTRDVHAGQTRIDLGGQPAGVYYIQHRENSIIKLIVQ